MVKSKIIWSGRAIKRLYRILELDERRNNSRASSAKLYRTIQKETLILPKLPEIGLRTTDDSIRVLFAGNCLLFYEITGDKIIIHTIWESGQKKKP